MLASHDICAACARGREQDKGDGHHVTARQRFADRRNCVHRDEQIDDPEHTGELKLHGERHMRRNRRQRDQEKRHERRRTPGERAVFRGGGAAPHARTMRQPQHREQAEVRRPCPERPLVGENEISSTERLNPERIHRRHRGAQRSGGDSPHQHEQDDHRPDGARHPPAAIEDHERRADEDREPHRCRDVTERGKRDERDRKPITPAAKRRDGDESDAERQDTLLEVRLERIHARPRDVMAQGDKRAERQRDPGRRIEA